MCNVPLPHNLKSPSKLKMPSSAFYRECTCSLLSVRPHPVTSRAEWARHLAVKEQDRLKELFGNSSSDEAAPGSESVESSLDGAAQNTESLSDEPESQNRVSESSLDGKKSGHDGAESSLNEGGTGFFGVESSNNDESGSTTGLKSPDPVGISENEWMKDYHLPIEDPETSEIDTRGVDYDVSVMSPDDGAFGGSQEVPDHEAYNDPQHSPPLDNEEISFDDELYVGVVQDSSDEREIAEDSEQVGRMKRGFVNSTNNNGGSSDNITTDDNLNNSSPDEFDEDIVESFPYGRRKVQMTRQEILSVALHDLKLSHRISRAAIKDITGLVESFLDDSYHCWDYRTTKKWIAAETGVQHVSYDCCKNSCMAFAMYPDKEECDYCQHPRWKTKAKRVPYATYEYIPIIHRLKLWYTDPTRSATMTSYRRDAEAHGKTPNMSSSHPNFCTLRVVLSRTTRYANDLGC